MGILNVTIPLSIQIEGVAKVIARFDRSKKIGRVGASCGQNGTVPEWKQSKSETLAENMGLISVVRCRRSATP